MIPIETIKYTVKTKVVRIVVLTVSSQMPGMKTRETTRKEFVTQDYFRA